DELEAIRRLARERSGLKERVHWPEATPPPAAVLEFLGRLHPETGMPLEDTYQLPRTSPAPAATRDGWALPSPAAPPVPPAPELPAVWWERYEAYQARWQYWCGLPAQQKTALAAFARWGAEASPLWLVQLVATDARQPDPGQPPVALRAATAADAQARYQRLCGING